FSLASLFRQGVHHLDKGDAILLRFRSASLLKFGHCWLNEFKIWRHINSVKFITIKQGFVNRVVPSAILHFKYFGAITACRKIYAQHPVNNKVFDYVFFIKAVIEHIHRHNLIAPKYYALTFDLPSQVSSINS